MDKKILTILVGTLCFGLGVATGIGMMTLKDMEQRKAPVQQEQPKKEPHKENEVQKPVDTDKTTTSQEEVEKPKPEPSDENKNQTAQKEPEPESEKEPEKQPEVETPSQGQVGGEGWQANTSYSIGQLASYDNKVYKCIQAHTALEGWEPHITPALWEPVK
ncbi:MAG: carbohydrate-binding protein [Cellulosilyticaceae bacterium]